MSDIDPEKLKVAELRDELKERGLDTKGVKAVLVQRLREALDDGVAVGDGGDAGDAEEGDEEETAEQEGEADYEVVEAVDDEEEEEEEEGEDAAAEKEGGDEAVAVEAGGEEKTEGETTEQNGDGDAAEGEAAGEGDEDVEMPDELGEEFKTIDETTQDDDTAEDRGTKRKRSRSRSRDRHRGRRSHSRERRRSRSPPIRKVEMDDCSWEAGTAFQIDRYNCDLNLRVQDEGLKAHPLTVEGFGFMWAGARAMFGVKAGKVAYEVKLMENLNVDHLPDDETNPHVLRLGWSADDTSMQLGEESLSFGYGGTSKASTECTFKDYGEKFTAGDVITAYLDMESDPVTLSFAKNGTDLGMCYEVEKEKLEDRALFPHVLTKNTEYECNFGSREEPYFPLQEGFEFLETVGQDDRVRGAPPPATKEECEIIMMVGLPGCGKTTWAEKHSIGNLEKKYNVLGTNNIIDKMKVMGLPRKKNYSGRWDVLIEKSTKCLNRLIEIAARKKRNYILDQTNVYASARRRKMQPFEGFQRKAVVVVPTDDEFKSRVEKREKDEGKEIPEKAVLEMKANFTLPEVGQLFDSVEYTEEESLNTEDAGKLIEKYKEEARKLLPPPEKRRDSRFSDRGRRDFNRDNRPRGGGYRGGFDRDRRGGGGGYRGGYGGGGGYNPRGGSSYDNRSRGRYDNRRFDDRRDNRSSGGYQGGQRSSGYNSGSSGYNKGWGNQGNWGNQGWGNQGYGNQGSGYGNRQGYGQWPQQSNWGQQNYWGGSGSSSGGYGSGYGSSSGYGSGYGGSGGYGYK